MIANKINGLWIVEFRDEYNQIQHTVSDTLCKAVCLAFVNRTTKL